MKRIPIRDKFPIHLARSKSKSEYFTQLSIDSDAVAVGVKLQDDECYALYRASDWVRACIEKIIQTCTTYELKVVPKDKSKKGGKSRIAKVQKFFDKPNKNKEGFFELRKKVLLDLLVINRAAIEKVWNNAHTRLLEVYSYEASNIRVKSKDGVLLENNTYVIKMKDGTQKTFDIDEMIYMVLCPTSNSWYGVKLLETLCDSIATDLLRNTYNSANFVNRGESSGILNINGLGRQDLRRFRADWEAKHKGASNAHRLAVVAAEKVEYTKMALTNKDLEFSEYGREILQKIFAVFGVMPYMMGLSFGQGAGIDPEKQIEVFHDGIIKSLLKLEAYYYTNEIIRDGFGYDDLTVEFPEASLRDKKKEADVDGVDIKNGVMTINERRAKLQMPPVPWGDTPISLDPGGPQVDPNTGKLRPPSQQSGNATNPPKPQAKPAPKKSYYDLYFENLVKHFDKLSKEEHINALFNDKQIPYVKNLIEMLRYVKGDGQDALILKDKLISSVKNMLFGE